MSKNCEIMKRMKENYEGRSKTFLTRRTPVIIRIDGKAFHTYTRGLDKPFDENLIEDMQETCRYLCENIQGAKLGYVQSDEISILLTDYDKLNTSAWFDYSVQKICSVSASMAAAKFAQLRYARVFERTSESSDPEFVINSIIDMKLAEFDSRCFNIPKEEVSNYFLARQKDAVKNSISMMAQSMYSQKELHGKNQSDMQELIFKKGKNWNDLDFSKKRGSTVIKNTYINDMLVGDTIKEIWYQPNIQSDFYPNEKGRALIYGESTSGEIDWCDIPIEKLRTKWDVVETPLTFDENYFKKLV